jgi:hypothetical protein
MEGIPVDEHSSNFAEPIEPEQLPYEVRNTIMYHHPPFTGTYLGKMRWLAFCNNRRNRHVHKIIKTEGKCKVCKRILSESIVEDHDTCMQDHRAEFVDRDLIRTCKYMNDFPVTFTNCKPEDRFDKLREMARDVHALEKRVGGCCSQSCAEIYEQKHARTPSNAFSPLAMT